MTTIIRATDRNRGAQPVAFNFDDMAGRANDYLDTVRAEAARIVAAARREAETVRRGAEAEGRRAALQAVEQMVAKQLATVLPALGKVVRDIRHAKQAWLTHWESSAVHVAAAIAGRLVRRDPAQGPQIAVTLLREALELAAGSSHLRIHLNGDDCKALGNQVDALVNELATLTTAEVVADPEITPGGCRVETNFGVIDQQFEAQLKRIEEELT